MCLNLANMGILVAPNMTVHSPPVVRIHFILLAYPRQTGRAVTPWICYLSPKTSKPTIYVCGLDIFPLQSLHVIPSFASASRDRARKCTREQGPRRGAPPLPCPYASATSQEPSPAHGIPSQHAATLDAPQGNKEKKARLMPPSKAVGDTHTAQPPCSALIDMAAHAGSTASASISSGKAYCTPTPPCGPPGQYPRLGSRRGPGRGARRDHVDARPRARGLSGYIRRRIAASGAGVCAFVVWPGRGMIDDARVLVW
jgi:hypothetical protein